MNYFDPIKGTEGRFASHLEIIATGTPAAMHTLKNKLTLTNRSIQSQIRRLQAQRPRSLSHLQSIQTQIQELKTKETTYCFAELPDGSLSIPPGCYFLIETLENPEVVTAPEIPVKWLGIERHYQITAVQQLLKRTRAAVQLATGTGKSKTIQVLCRSLTAAGKRVLVIVPSIELLKQTFFPLQDDGTFTVTMLGGGNVPRLGCQVVVSTMQSAFGIADQFDAIITDEMQHNSCDSIQRIFVAAINAEFVYGLSASPWRGDGMSQLIFNFCGPLVFRYSGAQAIREGFLAPLKYIQQCVPVTSAPKPGVPPIKKYIKLHSTDQFLDAAEKLVRQALDKKRKVLVLYKSIECCKKLGARLGVQSADGNYRQPFYAFKKGEADLCIANISLLGEGIDVPDISAIIYCAGSTSEISVVQAFGRGTRKSPNKTDCIIVDLHPNLPDWRIKANVRKRYFRSHFELDNFQEADTLTLEDIQLTEEE